MDETRFQKTEENQKIIDGKQAKRQESIKEIKDSFKEMKEKCNEIANRIQLLLRLYGIEDKETEIGVTAENSKEASPLCIESVSAGKLGINSNGDIIINSSLGENQNVLKGHFSGEDVQDCLLEVSRDSVEEGDVVVRNFNNLLQHKSVVEYQDTFAEFKVLMLIKNDQLAEDYIVDRIPSGLRYDIKHQVQLFKPKQLEDVILSARLHEAALKSFSDIYKEDYMCLLPLHLVCNS